MREGARRSIEAARRSIEAVRRSIEAACCSAEAVRRSIEAARRCGSGVPIAWAIRTACTYRRYTVPDRGLGVASIIRPFHVVKRGAGASGHVVQTAYGLRPLFGRYI